MTQRWRTIPLLLVSLLSPSLVYAAHSFENTAVVRTVELGGALVHVTTTYAVKSLENGSQDYVVSLSEAEAEKTSWIEAKIKGQSETLSIQTHVLNPQDGVFLYNVQLPNALSVNATVNLVVDTVQTHATYPWPREAAQNEEQSLKYESDLFVLSPYKTATQRTKIRAPVPRIISFTTPEDLGPFTTDSVATKSGATITYGPFSNIPPSANKEFLEKHQKPVAVHYHYEYPVIEITKLVRAAEISHWGANLNIDNQIDLHNAGPTLKGHFSRLEHQSQMFYNRLAAHVLPAFNMHLPPGVHSPYFYDLNGNVSTSRFRSVPSVPKAAQANQFSVLELRPRYPVMGGWNYSFTLGWDSPLMDSAAYDAATGKYIVAVPVHTPIAGSVVDDAEVKIIFPEGATDIEVFPPFPPLSESRSTHITYLDTVGRPAVTFKYKNLTEKHAGLIYASYKVPFSAHLQKTKAVATAFLGLFALALLTKRVDLRLIKA
ncbi:oligosaccharyl transferase alpha subunit [Dentipellis sp. KUC8613]|nr:oligosaccharyl transferase alpha subunit [Dentipellis sp. KUC8613]